MTAHCPKCDVILHCPCPPCRQREPPGLTERDHYHWQANGEIIECPKCGYSDHCDQWLTAEMKRINGGS